MAANSSAHPSRAGFNQSGGAYFYIVNTLSPADGTAGVYVNTLATAPSGSGGDAKAPTFALAAATAVVGSGTVAANAGALFATGKLIKDMGKTVVSSGRVFRKFAVAATGNAGFNSSLGVAGAPGVAPNTGYATFYLEVGREGQGAAAPAPIVRYF